jgi:hypothetical protein
MPEAEAEADRFRCLPYGCEMSGHACADRHTQANADRSAWTGGQKTRAGMVNVTVANCVGCAAGGQRAAALVKVERTAHPWCLNCERGPRQPKAAPELRDYCKQCCNNARNKLKRRGVEVSAAAIRGVFDGDLDPTPPAEFCARCGRNEGLRPGRYRQELRDLCDPCIDNARVSIGKTRRQGHSEPATAAEILAWLAERPKEDTVPAPDIDDDELDLSDTSIGLNIENAGRRIAKVDEQIARLQNERADLLSLLAANLAEWTA